MAHQDAYLRAAACAALPNLTGKSDPEALKALEIVLSEPADPNCHVRNAALHSYLELSEVTQQSLALICKRLEDAEEMVRRTVTNNLAAFAGKGNKGALADVAVRLRHPKDGVRKAAVLALGKLAMRRHEKYLTTLENIIDEDVAPIVRRAAVTAFFEVE
eukprot:TRINITY_DN13078_c0_g1_i1.p2 TRINITY_DN13078_c0_g1~~TRINITY_DN13078_c0_g1_i1.p2  ORF type:complete len:160 (-),score=47.46 TRINITY_DN13078_c0_g1_i1:298-777(-)